MSKDKNIPTHVAIIMDGNGRWAEKRILPRALGHNAGMKAMKGIVKEASILGIKHLTVYAFSTENWKRSDEEVGAIFKLLIKYVESELAELNENKVRVRVLGDYSPIPALAKESLEKLLRETETNDGLQLNIALNYGGRMDITRAVKSICKDVAEGIINFENIDEELIGKRLYTGIENGEIPDPDMIIRTSGEMRLSNFLLWQSAYSEFFPVDTLWPDFSREEFRAIVESFGQRDRRFGGRK